jgi:F0F1-type ATP synthase membrane subunit b/b'
MDTTDDFELLGRAVARVLREAFATAADAREGMARQHDTELDGVIAEMRALPAKIEQERRDEAKAFTASLAEAKQTIDDAVSAARDEAETIRAQAVADAKAIVEGATAEVARARELVAEERVRLDTELKALVRDVRREVAKLEQSAIGDHSEMLDRATTEAQMILRQARLHHRSTAKEVDRMIEAAAAEAASLRKQALSDAARVAARVRGVVDVPREVPVDDLPLRGWKRPEATPPVDDAEVAPAPANVVEHQPRSKRRGNRLAS